MPSPPPDRPRAVAVVGPTASGKSEWGIRIARALDGEVVSADSRQVYRRLDIGTAKPTAEMREAVPHHCLDIAAPIVRCSLAEFLAAARAAVADIEARGKLPVIVGGSGQYVTALIEGWVVPPAAPNERLRGDLEAFANAYGAGALHRELARHDPVSAGRIDARNLRRVIRALEIHYITGTPMSEWTKQRQPLPCLVTAPLISEEALDARIEARTRAMFDAGLVDEVRTLLATGVGADAPGFDAIGYREVVAHLRGGPGLDETIAAVAHATRRFARRQRAWFRAGDERIRWRDDAPVDELRGVFGKMRSA